MSDDTVRRWIEQGLLPVTDAALLSRQTEGVLVVVKAGSTTFDELGKGSMKMIALTSMIENELDAEVPVREVMVMKNIAELVARVEEEME